MTGSHRFGNEEEEAEGYRKRRSLHKIAKKQKQESPWRKCKGQRKADEHKEEKRNQNKVIGEAMQVKKEEIKVPKNLTSTACLAKWVKNSCWTMKRCTLPVALGYAWILALQFILQTPDAKDVPTYQMQMAWR